MAFNAKEENLDALNASQLTFKAKGKIYKKVFTSTVKCTRMRPIFFSFC